MASSFQYLPFQLATIETLLSKERFSPYLRAANNDPKAALLLYERNTLFSESLHGVLQSLEVAVRNSMHAVLQAGFQKPDWYNYAPLESFDLDKISEAQRQVRRANKTAASGQIVANLTFGFWVGLTSKKYHMSLWTPYLYKAFPSRRRSSQEVHQRLVPLRDLRNRVAHHEPIWNRNLKADLANILDTLRWIEPNTADWVQATNSLQTRLT